MDLESRVLDSGFSSIPNPWLSWHIENTCVFGNGKDYSRKDSKELNDSEAKKNHELGTSELSFP